MKGWLYRVLITERLNNTTGLFIFTGIALTIAYLLSTMDSKMIALFIILLVSLPFFCHAIVDIKFGFYLVLTASFFMSLVNRLLPVGVPFGVVIDAALAVLTFFVLIGISKHSKDYSFSDFGNTITYTIIIWVIYYLIQAVNPEGTIAGWTYGIRNIVRMLMIYLVFWKLFDNLNTIRQFTNIYFLLAAITALYGLYQEFFGLPSHDLRWATATESRINLLYIAGQWRKFSVLPDSASFGLFMALIVILSSILSIYNKQLRYAYIGLAFLSLLGMFAAGIRTAYAILPISILFYVTLNITNIRVIAFSSASVLVFAVLYFGPFYNPTIERFRSAFNPSEDKSMQLRDINREVIRPYIHSHPLGGGLSTTGANGIRFAPNHFLSGFPPDSGFMEALLETGWLGLLIEIFLYMLVLAKGIFYLFKTKSREIRSYYIAYMVAFFTLTIAYYAKKGVDQFPLNFFLYGTFVLVTKLRTHDLKMNTLTRINS